MVAAVVKFSFLWSWIYCFCGFIQVSEMEEWGKEAAVVLHSKIENDSCRTRLTVVLFGG